MTSSEEAARIENWRMKKLIQRLTDARGAGTSMISLILPPGDQIARVNRMLSDEYGTATNIKSRVNRLSVLDAITSTQQRLKLYHRTPPNGLVLFCGTILTEEGKEKRVTVDFEPIKPINTSLYMCDSRFHTDALKSLLMEEEVYGFIIMNGDGCLYATISGNVKTVLYSFTVDLPNKHRRGGQSSVRFARLRMEARGHYVKKVAEMAIQYFITDNMPNVRGLILAGSADFKTELSRADFFDARLSSRVLLIVDVSYGGNRGLGQAIELSSECLGNTRLMQEKKLLKRFLEEIARDTGRYCFMVEDTMRALEMGAVETLLVWEQLDLDRHVAREATTGEEKVLLLPRGAPVGNHVILETETFVEWCAQHYHEFGTILELVSNNTEEGSQFIRGFSGVGGILRWKLDADPEINGEEDFYHRSTCGGGDPLDNNDMEDIF